MAFTIHVVSTQKEYIQANNSDAIVVSFEILDSGSELVENRKLSFDLDTSADDIKNELTKFIATYNADHENALKSAEMERKQEDANKTIEELKDFKI